MKIGEKLGTLGEEDAPLRCLVSHPMSSVLAKASMPFFICPHDGGVWIRIAWVHEEMEKDEKKKEGDEKDEEKGEEKNQEKKEEEEKDNEKEEKAEPPFKKQKEEEGEA